jgi:hypothetical protein
MSAGAAAGGGVWEPVATGGAEELPLPPPPQADSINSAVSVVAIPSDVLDLMWNM